MAEQGFGSTNNSNNANNSSPPAAIARHFSDTETLAYVSMRGATGHGHFPRDEALEPLARVIYEPRTIEAVQAEVDRAISEISVSGVRWRVVAVLWVKMRTR